MSQHQYKMKAKVWLYTGVGAWHFVTLPVKQSKEIKSLYGGMKKGWGSIPVNVTIGTTTWKTSIFPDTKSNAYLLPLKADIRKKENILDGDTVTFYIDVAL